ncbi:hypothetical protein [Nocardia wallacei]|uniref:hypothetical protein n=1 Tax=Nocardia wallacei TaxID=480035 RepID=UPI0024558525|nr:hypothetical protein [Nocardia wallacei]
MAKSQVEGTPAASRPRKRRPRVKAKTRTPQRLERRLSPTTVDELVQTYLDGTSAARLDTRYRVSKTAILDLLARRGITRRYRSMTPTDVDHAERLYLAGHSLTACAQLTGFPASSINRALNKRGTSMRPAGRPRGSSQ